MGVELSQGDENSLIGDANPLTPPPRSGYANKLNKCAKLGGNWIKVYPPKLKYIFINLDFFLRKILNELVTLL